MVDDPPYIFPVPEPPEVDPDCVCPPVVVDPECVWVWEVEEEVEVEVLEDEDDDEYDPVAVPPFCRLLCPPEEAGTQA